MWLRCHPSPGTRHPGDNAVWPSAWGSGKEELEWGLEGCGCPEGRHPRAEAGWWGVGGSLACGGTAQVVGGWEAGSGVRRPPRLPASPGWASPATAGVAQGREGIGVSSGQLLAPEKEDLKGLRGGCWHPRGLGEVTVKAGAWLAALLRVPPGWSQRERRRRINKRPPTYRVSGLTPQPGGTRLSWAASRDPGSPLQ